MIKSLDDVTTNRVVGLIVGPSAIGKTSLFGTLEGRTLIASAESGLLSLKKFPKEVRDRIQFWEINTMDDLKKFFLYCASAEGKNRYQNIGIDSLTEIGDKLLLELKADEKLGADNMALKMFGKYNDDFTKIIKALRDMRPYNVWFTCLNKWEKDGLEMREEFNFPGSKVKDNIQAWFDIVLKYEVFEKDDQKFRKLISDVTVNRLAKDRSGKLLAYENPHLGDVTKKILGELNG